MSDTTTTTTPTTPPATRESTIHDAIDALFASKEPAPTTPPETPAAETEQAPAEAPPESTEATTEQPAEGEPPAEGDKPATPPPEATKVSAADYAIQLAKARKKVDAIKKAQPPAPAQPSAEALRRAAALEAAGGDPLKQLEAAGLDLAKVVRAYDERMSTNPESVDPLAAEVKELATKLSHYEKREEAAKDAAAKASFVAEVKTRTSKAGEEFELIAEHGDEGAQEVLDLVLGYHARGEVLKLPEAMKMVEAAYLKDAQISAKSKKVQKLIAPQTPPKKPGLGQQAPGAGTAPTAPTKPLTSMDVINNAIDAVIG